jgi:hypothetical protein
MSLAEYSNLIESEYDLGAGASFYDTTIDLCWARAQLALCKPVASRIQVELDRLDRRGTVPEKTADDGRVVRRVGIKPAGHKRVLDSKSVKLAHPALYERARVLKPQIKVTPPFMPEITVAGLVAVSQGDNVRVLSRALDALAEVRKPLYATEAVLKARMEEIARAIEWDGCRRVFGKTGEQWSVMTRQLTFDAAEFIAHHPTIADEFMMEAMVPAKPGHLRLNQPKDEDDTEGDAEPYEGD